MTGPAEVFALHFLDGMSQAEVAQTIGTSRRTVVKRIAAIRQTLTQLAPKNGSAP